VFFLSKVFIFLSLVFLFCLNIYLYLEPVTIHPYVDQFPQHMSNERPKTAISKKEANTILFDDNDDAAELLPD